MAKFREGNLKLKDTQKVYLGDSDDHTVYGDSSELYLDDVAWSTVSGSAADIAAVDAKVDTTSGTLQAGIDGNASGISDNTALITTTSGVIVSQIITDHSGLDELDYASAAHTGFASTEALITTSGVLSDQIIESANNAPTTYYLHEEESDIGGHESLIPTPSDDPESHDTVVIGSGDGETAIEPYITASGDPNTTAIPPGTWNMVLWADIDSIIQGPHYIRAKWYRREEGGTEHFLFEQEAEIISTSPTRYVVDTSVSGIDMNVTDRLVVSMYAQVGSVGDKTIGYYVEGVDRSTRFSTPVYTNLISNHTDLTGLTSDDHLHYHTDARGDARYYTETELDAGQLDNRYYTETEADVITDANTALIATTSGTLAGDLTTHASSADHDGRYYTETEADVITDANTALIGTTSGTLQTAIDAKPDTLLELTDTPAGYDDGKVLTSTADGTEWTTVSGGSGTSNHSELDELDYASAGHTGFVSDVDFTTYSGTLQSQITDNTTHSTGDGSDHADVATNTAASHAESHSVASHSDTTGTGSELDELTDGSETTLHSHAGGGGDKIEEGNSSVEVVDTGTGYVVITVDGVESARFISGGDFNIVGDLKMAGDAIINWNENASSTLSIGKNAGTGAAGALQNIIIGEGAGAALSSADRNTMIGYGAGALLAGGSENTMIGHNCAARMTGGEGNLFFGRQTAYGITGSANDNVQVGQSSGYNCSGSNNAFLGRNAAYNGGTGSSNAYVGDQAGKAVTGNYNTAIGHNALLGDAGTGAYNTCLGASAGKYFDDGTYNICIGYNAGAELKDDYKLMIDVSNTATPLISGDFTDDYVGINTLSASGTLNVGGHICPGTDDSFDLGQAGMRWDDVFATNATIQTSDERKKEEIEDIPYGVDLLNDLRPIQYKWKDYSVSGVEVEYKHRGTGEFDESGSEIEESYTVETPWTREKTFSRKHFGFSAQEMETSLNDSGIDTADFAPFVYDAPTDTYGVRQGELVPILVKAIQELSARVAALEA